MLAKMKLLSRHMLRDRIKWLLFPGTNLNARLRYRLIPKHLQPTRGNSQWTILDAGCGNGAIAYQCYRRGYRVLGVSIKDEVVRNQRLFNEMLGIPKEALCFKELNLYEVEQLGENQFDEIICTEVLEHIRGDHQVVAGYYRVLKPGGVLHVCCPNADHPYHRRYPLDPNESGGHVRSGYTEATYRELLEPVGFEVSRPVGVGGYWRHQGNEWIRAIERIGGVQAGVMAFLFVAPLPILDRVIPSTPFSLYVQARKPSTSIEIACT